MTMRDNRAGYSQARFNEGAFNFIGFEIILAALAVGVATKSWWWGGGVLFALLFGLFFRMVAWPMALAFSLAWGGAAWVVGTAAWGIPAGWVLAGIAFLASLGAHIGAMDYARDIGRAE